MRLGCLGIAIAALLIWAGGQGTYEAMTNRRPTEMTCGDVAQAAPHTSWLRLTGCVADVTDSVYRERGGEVKELFIPLRPAGPKDAKPVHVLLSTKDPQLLALAQEMVAVDKANKPSETLLFVVKNRDRLRVQRPIEGMVRSGIDKDDKVQSQIQGLRQKDLAADFVVLDDGREPRLGVSLAMLLGGVAILGSMVTVTASRR